MIMEDEVEELAELIEKLIGLGLSHWCAAEYIINAGYSKQKPAERPVEANKMMPNQPEQKDQHRGHKVSIKDNWCYDCECRIVSEPKEQKCEHAWSNPATGNGYMCCIKDGCNAYTFYSEPKDSVKWPEKKSVNQYASDCSSFYQEGWNACHDAFMTVINERKDNG